MKEMNVKAEIEEKQKDREVARRMEEKEYQTNLKIKKETEIVRIVAEIEQWKKDKEFQRFQRLTEAITKYQKELTQINVEAIKSIGELQIDLEDRAIELIHEKTVKYKSLQKEAFEEAVEDLKKIEEQFSNNENARRILEKSVEQRLVNITEAASKFIFQLAEDMKALNQNITLLTKSGQKFIEQHLSQFKNMGLTEDDIKRLSDGNDGETIDTYYEEVS